jgi:hypothetical protein
LPGPLYGDEGDPGTLADLYAEAAERKGERAREATAVSVTPVKESDDGSFEDRAQAVARNLLADHRGDRREAAVFCRRVCVLLEQGLIAWGEHARSLGSPCSQPVRIQLDR